jgi:hypothetical protein
MIREEAENIADLAYDPWAAGGSAHQPGEYKSAADLERKLERSKGA